MKELLLLWIYLDLFPLLNAVHFLGGTITWKPVNASATGSPIAVAITQTYSWTYSYMSCSNSLIGSSGYIPSYAGVSSETLDCISNCGSSSAGYSNISVLPRCTDFSTSVDTSVAQRTDIVNLSANDDFWVAFQDSSWRPLQTASSADWSIAAHINLKKRSDTGLYNNAPVATMMSPINIPQNTQTVIQIPVGDADGDDLRCRWSTKSGGVDECGDVCPPGSLPSGTVIYPNCTMIITGTILDSWYAVTVMVEDFTSTSSSTPLSSVPVQFLVHVVAPPTCPTPPEIIGIPEEQSCIAIGVGQTFLSQIFAVNYCPSPVVIQDIATLSFTNMIKGNLVNVNSSLYYKNLTWTPTSAQLGYQVMCAMAFDSKNSQSAQYCFKLFVTDNPICACPGEPCLTTTSTTSTSETTTTSILSTSTSTSATSTIFTSTTSATTTTTTTYMVLLPTTSVTMTTETTSTTRTTAITSTISSIFMTNTTSTTKSKENPKEKDWPWIESIFTILTSAGIIVLCFFCFHYCCSLGNRLYGFEIENENIEMFHIAQCNKSNCSFTNIHINTSDYW
ncbi:unnamed protein product [Adineta ricciae]|uniref:Uncharacterized protein n=1 Tax=Adineta ricciae TaxID=249248 RepID=A0A816CUH9_ADIRI|nr:unnamed protein product [Adineta ricciae]